MIDYIIIGIIVFSVIVSLLRGFVREVMSLASWIVAFFIASNFYVYLAGLLTSIESLYIRNGVAIAILFIASLIVGAIVNYVLGQLVDRTGLSGTDRVLGACFGLLRGVLIVADWFFQQLQANSSFLNSTLNLEQVTTPASNPTPTSTQNQ